MMKNYVFFATMIVILSTIPTSFEESGKYDLKVDDKTFGVSYNFDGQLISMDIDKEAKSLLVGTTGVSESTFEISLPDEVISAESDEFVILLDGVETNYSITHSNGMTKFAFTVPIATEEVEIIGTSVVPEFPLGALIVMGMVSSIVLIFSKTRLVRFR